MKLEVPGGLHNDGWVEKAVYYHKIYIYIKKYVYAYIWRRQ